jgi:hypothetical protein
VPEQEFFAWVLGRFSQQCIPAVEPSIFGLPWLLPAQSIPQARLSVGSISIALTSASICRPAGITPGQLMMQGTRLPPSSADHLCPRNGIELDCWPFLKVREEDAGLPVRIGEIFGHGGGGKSMKVELRAFHELRRS